MRTHEVSEMAKHLTANTLKTKPHASHRLSFADDQVKGLTLRIMPSGARSFLIRYRVKGETGLTTKKRRPGAKGGNRKQRSVTLEVVDERTALSEARRRALEILAAAKRGIDLPAEKKRQDDERARAEAAAEFTAASARTVRQLVTEYVENHCKAHLRRPRDTELRLTNHVLPKIGDRMVSELRRADIVELLDELEHEKKLRQQVNRTRTSLSGMFRYAVEREYLAENPVMGTRSRKMELECSRVLTDDELKAIWHALEEMPEPGRSFVRVLMLTGVRRDEARGMRWAEADLDAALWLLPAKRNKSGRDFEIPLSKQMVALLKELTRLGPCVFTVNAKGEKPWSAHGPFKADLDARSGVTGWILHDLRRTVRSRLAEDLHVPYEVAERVLNHAMTKIERTYNRASYREQKAAALQAWADRLALIVGDAGGDNVTVLRASA